MLNTEVTPGEQTPDAFAASDTYRIDDATV
jgi:hypothetical protein